MPQSPDKSCERVLGQIGENGPLPLPPVVGCDVLPVEGELQTRSLRAPVVPVAAELTAFGGESLE